MHFNVKSEIEVTEEDTDVVILDFVVLVLRSTLSLVPIVVNVQQLLLTSLDQWLAHSGS